MYWITLSPPTEETVASLGLGKPREQFGDLTVKAHDEKDVAIIEKLCFSETHASGDRDHICLVRAKTRSR